MINGALFHGVVISYEQHHTMAVSIHKYLTHDAAQEINFCEISEISCLSVGSERIFFAKIIKFEQILFKFI
ncbi:hypothetical protein PAHAL_3G162200 [Panicum hallii]|jgi:hypothetical protein|uniref:Uncharacterized protein n=1 Tax=Panicum hallii TaxID=206008 RepID=A0A2T8KIG2_9POAL|nr:hypothetical protein PAHAL_3G162200 [Panicum hallii]